MKLKCLLVPFKSKLLFIKPCTKLPRIFKFSFKFKKLICIRAFTICHRRRRHHPSPPPNKTVNTVVTQRKNRIRGFFSIFCRRKRSTSASTSTTTSTSSFSSSRRSLFSSFRRRRRQGRRRSTALVQAEEIEDELGELRNMTTADQAAAAAAGVPLEKKIFPSPLTPAYVRLISGSDKKKVRGGQNFDDVDDACRSFENYLVEMIVEEGKLADLMDVEELLYCWKNLKCPVFRDMVSRFYGELCRDLFSSVGQDDDDYVEEKESIDDDHHFKYVPASMDTKGMGLMNASGFAVDSDCNVSARHAVNDLYRDGTYWCCEEIKGQVAVDDESV